MTTMTMRIGELAMRAGVNVQTVRYYERRGLLHDPRRRSAGYREYTDATLDRFVSSSAHRSSGSRSRRSVNCLRFASIQARQLPT